jgi:PAS domain S-box-containing protein
MQVNEQEVAAAVLAGPDAVIAADHEGVVTYWNAAAERIFGFTAEEALGNRLDLIVPERLRDRHWQGWHQVMAAGRGRHPADELFSVPSLRKDGTQLSLEFTVHPIVDCDGSSVRGMAATLRDVTNR